MMTSRVTNTTATCHRRRRSSNMSPVTSSTSRSIYQSSKSAAYFPMFFKGGSVPASSQQNDFISCPRPPPQENMAAPATVSSGSDSSQIECEDSMNLPKAPRIKRMFQTTQGGGGNVLSSAKLVPSSALHSHQERWEYQSSLAGAHKQDPEVLGEYLLNL